MNTFNNRFSVLDEYYGENSNTKKQIITTYDDNEYKKTTTEKLSFKNILEKSNIDNDDNSVYKNLYTPEKDICKIFIDDNKKIQKIIHPTNLANMYDEYNINFNLRVNTVFNNMINRWRKYEEDYIELYGIDNFEKYHIHLDKDDNSFSYDSGSEKYEDSDNDEYEYGDYL